MTFVLILYFDWLQGPHIWQNFEKHSKIFFSETVKGIKLVLCIHVPDSGLYIICVFYSRRIRTLVAMATYASHRLTMEKCENSQFLLSCWRYLNFVFAEMFIE